MSGGHQSVWTDGSCRNQGNPNATAGYGVYWGPGHPNNRNGPVAGHQDSNRAELRAAQQAVRTASRQGVPSMTIRSDSHYVRDAVANSAKFQSVPAVNRDLHQSINAMKARTSVSVQHVPSNSSHGNQKAHGLAKAAASGGGAKHGGGGVHFSKPHFKMSAANGNVVLGSKQRTRLEAMARGPIQVDPVVEAPATVPSFTTSILIVLQMLVAMLREVAMENLVGGTVTHVVCPTINHADYDIEVAEVNVVLTYTEEKTIGTRDHHEAGGLATEIGMEDALKAVDSFDQTNPLWKFLKNHLGDVETTTDNSLFCPPLISSDDNFPPL
ncbi:unnamed protein product [Caenorhabditis sp. 36 PRJEB53466]|nr:unnamed protein product [Caenorhabditis sp. 36 PRJEB53466]